MRAALHFRPASSSPSPTAHRGRHRFVQDGAVPVVVVNPRHHRPEEDGAARAKLERALACEREARQAAKKGLNQAAETIRQLQTRLAHAEIAQREAAPAPAPGAPRAEAVSPPNRPQRPKRTPARDKPIEGTSRQNGGSLGGRSASATSSGKEAAVLPFHGRAEP